MSSGCWLIQSARIRFSLGVRRYTWMIKLCATLGREGYPRMPQDFIHVKGAREHNLKNIEITVPRDKLVVITGVSGSGKSSLAFDTIYAEGAAALRGVPVGLRPAVPGTDGQARRRLH